MARRAFTPEAEASAALEQRNRLAQYALYDYRARHAEEGATVSAAEAAIWSELRAREAACFGSDGEMQLLVEAREEAIADLEALGVPRPQTVTVLHV